MYPIYVGEIPIIPQTMPFGNYVRKYWLQSLSVGIFLIISVILLSIIYYTSQNATTSSVSQLTVQSLLILVTTMYALITLWLVHETRVARIQDVKPVFSVEALGDKTGVANIGQGPARELDISLKLIPDGPSKDLEQKLVRPNEYVAVTSGDIAEIDDLTSHVHHEYDALKVFGTYEDIYGNEYEINNESDGDAYLLRRLAKETGGNLSKTEIEEIRNSAAKIEDHIAELKNKE